MRDKLKSVQSLLDQFPHNAQVKEEAVKVLNDYNEAMKDEESLLFQKAKVNWMREGDKNTSFFHKVVKEKFHRSIIVSICDKNGIRYENEHVAGKFVDHFQKFLRCTDNVDLFPQDEDLFIAKLSNEEAGSMVNHVNKTEIKKLYLTLLTKKLLVLMVFPPNSSNLLGISLARREGYFKSGRGLRQGDPIFPYLFTMIMKMFNLILKKKTRGNKEFRYHFGCKRLEITHPCFADDLIVLCNGDIQSVSVIKQAFEEFSNISGLKPHLNKTKKDSMWLKWIHEERLKGTSTWKVEPDVNTSWGWRNLLKIRDKIGHHLFHKIGNGKGVSAWHDRWHDLCPLDQYITNRDLYEESFSQNDNVVDLVDNGVWKWSNKENGN
nr:RNA-directed DNA polymerase, eukaryota, reverse transcriptase zinc-binding domain protein [Tanacetum cinerariifolium]